MKGKRVSLGKSFGTTLLLFCRSSWQPMRNPSMVLDCIERTLFFFSTSFQPFISSSLWRNSRQNDMKKKNSAIVESLYRSNFPAASILPPTKEKNIKKKPPTGWRRGKTAFNVIIVEWLGAALLTSAGFRRCLRYLESLRTVFFRLDAMFTLDAFFSDKICYKELGILSGFRQYAPFRLENASINTSLWLRKSAI